MRAMPLKLLQYHAAQFPVLSRIARDYLAIQGSAVASEQAFSSGGRTGTKLRNRLTAETFEALQILKDAYRTGMIKTDEEVLKYIIKPWSMDDSD